MVPSPTQAFGKAVSELRAERNLSQEDAALASGIDRAYFGHIERATKSPTLKTVWKIAEALEVMPSELLRRAEKLLGG
jgi:transcriptional regulator with XRE-family HTH domain